MLDSIRNVVPYSWLRTEGGGHWFPTRLYYGALRMYLWLLLRSQHRDKKFHEQLQQERFRKMYARAMATAYGRKTLPSLTFSDDLNTLLQKIPCSDRVRLMESPPKELVGQHWIKNPSDMIIRRTSGTTGIPFSWGLDNKVFFVDSMAYFLRLMINAGFRPSLSSGPFVCSLNFDITRNPMRAFGVNVEWSPASENSENKIHKIAAILQSRQMQVLFTYSSDLWLFTQELQKRDIHPHLKLIIATGQQLEPEIREFAETYFKCPVVSSFATQEMVSVAVECPVRRDLFHINEERILVEIVNGDGTPAKQSEWGTLVLTCLDNIAMPLIRYSTGDQARVETTECGCGNNLRLLSVRGRDTEFIQAPNETLLPASRIGSYLMKEFFSKLYQYQIRQECDGLTLLIVPRNDNFTVSEIATIEHALDELVAHSLHINVQQVRTIPRDGSKFKRFVPLTPPTK